MSNINITSGSSYLEFLGDYEIESVEMTSGDELNGEAVMKVLIDGEGYESIDKRRKERRSWIDCEKEWNTFHENDVCE